jgi:hypothetical protein
VSAPAGTAPAEVVAFDKLTRAERAKLPVAPAVAEAVALEHGVCVRPIAYERIELATGRIDVVPMACGSTRADQCPPCAEKARRLRMAQCREGWHLTDEPDLTPNPPSEEQKAVLAARADLTAAYTQARAEGDQEACEEIAEGVRELDTLLRQLGVRGRLGPLDLVEKQKPARSTKRRQDAPDLPRRPVERRTVG